ncbi:MAG: glycosyltransferase [Oscillospiraceae bacterium]|nr:glycosyltransferase [Oscillospiraceae bacterium]
MSRRICVYCDLWESGGIESFLFNTLSRMDLSGMEIDLVAAEIRESIFSKPLEEKGVRFIELSGSTRNIPKNHREFRKLLRSRNYSVIHINAFQGMAFYYAHLGRAAGVSKILVHSHNSGLRNSLLKREKLLLHKAYSVRYAEDVTDYWACSRLAAEFLFPDSVMKQQGFIFVPNAVDIERFCFDPTVRTRIRKELGVEEKLVLGNVGRLCEQKNQSFLLDVLSGLINRGMDCNLLLVGSGPAMEELKRKAEELNLQKSVIFTGVSSHVEELLCAMDVFLFPSLFEGLPISVIEAQASGLPVIYHDILAEEAAIMPDFSVLPLEVEKWVEKILSTKRNKQREAAALKMKQTLFDIDSLSSWLEKEYRG